jgi:ABC-type sugar transport system ATPase subunit
VIHGISFDIADGEFMVLVGPSGCGKSTLLRMLAGLEDITSGTIAIDGRVVNDVDPTERDIAMVFQSYALYPHMTAFDNMAFALKMRGVDRTEIKERVLRAARSLDIEHLLDRKPRALSGGQRQRIAIGRAVVREPKVFLMDEPLSNLDAKLRVTMRAEIKKLHQRLRTTFVYVTHDQTEAMTLGDRICVLDGGVLQQCDTPHALYHHPENLFVATFIGSPQMNVLRGTLANDGATATVSGQGFKLEVPRAEHEGDVLVGVRPEHTTRVPSRAVTADGGLGIRGTVDLVEPLGFESFVTLALRGEGTRAPFLYRETDSGDSPELRPGDEVVVTIAPSRVHLFDPKTERRIAL